jgi:hypothetical protein
MWSPYVSEKLKCKIFIFVTTIFGRLSVLMLFLKSKQTHIMHNWAPRVKISPLLCIFGFPRSRKVPIMHICEFPISKYAPIMYLWTFKIIYEILKSKQTPIMHVWTFMIKIKTHYAFLWIMAKIKTFKAIFINKFKLTFKYITIMLQYIGFLIKGKFTLKGPTGRVTILEIHICKF